MRKFIAVLGACLLMLAASGCTDEQKMNNAKATVLSDCGGRTLEALVSEVVQNPVWGIEKDAAGKYTVSVKGTLIGDKLPEWVKEQGVMEVTFRFPLDAENKLSPTVLDGFPSLTAPEGILQAYKALACP